jgi:hypothetical protein
MQMAKLTAAQKRELKRLHQSRTGIVVQHYGIQLMQVYGGLQAKGLVDNQMYHDQTRFTLTESGLTLAASLFGSSEPTPPVTPSPTPSGEPEPVAGESVADSRDTSSDTAISNSAVPVTALTDDMLTASRDQWNERTEALIADSELPFASFDKPSFQWTHNANEMPRPVVTGWRSIHQATWLFAEREGVTGHSRTSRNRANKGHKGVKSQRKLSSITMERNESKQAANRAKYSQQIERRNLALLDMLSRIHVVNFPQVVNKKRAA